MGMEVILTQWGFSVSINFNLEYINGLDDLFDQLPSEVELFF